MTPVMEHGQGTETQMDMHLQQMQQLQPPFPFAMPHHVPDGFPVNDLSPASKNFERIQAMLTGSHQQNITGFPPYPQGPQYPGPMGHMGAMGYMGYSNPPVPYAGQTNATGFGPQFASAPPFHPGPQNMSRTPSNTEKPGTPGGHGGQPVIVGAMGQQGKSNYSKPVRKSAAITIKRPDGEEVDLKNLATPSSPAPSLQQSKTPPITTTSSTPPTKPSTPAHGRSDSHAPQKTAKEVQEELRAKIAQATKSSADAKEEETRAAAEKASAEKAAAEKAASEKAAAEAKAKAEAEAKAKKEAEEKALEEARLEAERKAKEEAEAKKVAEEAKRKEEEAAAAKAAEEVERKKREEEEEMERMIAEMEEEDRRREEAQAKITAEKEAQKAVEKAEADKRRATETAEADRKLQEQEREMERLEEEREERARVNAASGLSVAQLLAQSKTGVPLETKVDAVADKLGAMAIGSGESKPTTPTSATGAKSLEKQQRKPAALNLSVNTKNVEAPQPSAALTSLKTSRFLTIKESLDPGLYVGSIASPNPALNVAVGKRGQAFKYDAQFLLQFQKVFTEQPSVEFTTQVKQLIGDNDGNRSAQARTPATAGGRQNSRTNSSFPGGTMATFGNFSSQPRTLPPGTTSESRFAQSQQQVGRPPMGSGMSFGPAGGSFPRSNLVGQMARQPSNSGMGPNSPRQGSRAGRGGSQKGGFNPKESKEAKTMPLTAGQEVKALTTTTTGWKPMSLAKSSQQSTADGYMEPKVVQRKVQAALNKMTPENFDRISDQILTIANQSKQEKDGRTLRQVIQLTFEKATDEPHFSSTYAKFCKRMLDQMSADIKDDTILDKHGNVVSGGNLFRKYLLNRCQEEFEKGWSIPTVADDTKEAVAVLLSDEYYENAAVKRRGLGLVRFIGELYKLGMLTERIITGCIHGLIDFKDEPKEAEIESLCFLMRTVGQQLEATEKGQPMMQVYFERIQKMIDLPTLENRLKFMLMDVRDLRNHGWQSKEANKGPKTLEEIRAETQAAALAKQQEAARSNTRGGMGGGRGGGGGRGDNRTFSAGYNHQASNTVGMDDLRRLKSGSRPIGAMTLGPHSMLASRSNSGRRGGPGSLSRTGEDSGMSSRTGTPPTHSASHSNAYGYVILTPPRLPLGQNSIY